MYGLPVEPPSFLGLICETQHFHPTKHDRRRSQGLVYDRNDGDLIQASDVVRLSKFRYTTDPTNTSHASGQKTTTGSASPSPVFRIESFSSKPMLVEVIADSGIFRTPGSFVSIFALSVVNLMPSPLLRRRPRLSTLLTSVLS
jgi:hypothetical protein